MIAKNQKIKSEDLIHVRLEYGDAVQSKKDILASEMALLRMLRTIKRYHLLRGGELNLKIDMLKKIKEIKVNIGKMQTTLPKLKIPDILQKEDESKEVKNAGQETKKPKEISHDMGLESQLQEIQEKLRALQ